MTRARSSAGPRKAAAPTSGGHAVFLRAVNVGGNTVSTRALGDALALVNIQAAGTFVSRDGRSAAALERAVRSALPFETEVIVRAAAELRAAIASLGEVPVPAGAKRFVTLLGAAPKTAPVLPIECPAGGDWEVRVTKIEGPFVLSLDQKRGPRRRFYPNEVVERALGVPATTRGWDTIAKVLETLG